MGDRRRQQHAGDLAATRTATRFISETLINKRQGAALTMRVMDVLIVRPSSSVVDAVIV